ncbi:SRPBCC family protein [Egicoccus sp. AB-alg6-2]|uniref:SRPBCC family protein n=1 Tax=Egicoccus sp. AB-alg6-2 TaxID=3242692 RepID=UPI00359E9AAE
MVWYDRRTHFHLGAPPAAVFDAMVDPRGFLAGWPRVTDVQRLVTGGDDGVGAVHRGTIAAALPYTLTWEMTTVRAERPGLIEWEARGDLEGHGLWRMFAVDRGTDVRFRWQVRTTPGWMNVLAPLARPALVWSHDRAMRDAAGALADYLDVPVSGFWAG